MLMLESLVGTERRRRTIVGLEFVKGKQRLWVGSKVRVFALSDIILHGPN
jgi:hypothetical protein